MNDFPTRSVASSPPAAGASVCTAVLVGNPNTGKSTLFNALSGMRQRVGNYPGVTVERRVGRMRSGACAVDIVDLPGTYSLAPRSPDEMLALDVLLGRRPDVPPPDLIICVVDANNLERNLFLVSQLTDLNRPLLVVLNMMDVAQRNGVVIDLPALSQRLGAPVVATAAHRRQGMEQLQLAIVSQLGGPAPCSRAEFPSAVGEEITALKLACSQIDHRGCPAFLAQRLLLDCAGTVAEQLDRAGTLSAQLQQSRQRLTKAGHSLAAIEPTVRYAHVARLLDSVWQRGSGGTQRSLSDWIDRVLTHRVWGTLIFAALMLLMFQAIFAWAGPLMDAIDGLVSAAAQWTTSQLAEGALKSLIVDGIFAGVGSVIIFLPQIFILFFFIALLEDCGYLARAAYLMDKLMCKVGLSGKSFIPLLSSFACAIPGIMAARVIDSRRDRMVTILVAPLMSCSARLPVYVLLIAAFIPDIHVAGWLSLQALTMFAMYAVGISVAVVVAFVLRKTMFRGSAAPFVMELPNYKFPSIRSAIYRMVDRGWAFVKRAGTLIFAVVVVLWALCYFPHPPQVEPALQRANSAEPSANGAVAISLQPNDARDAQRQAAAAQIRQSFLGRAGVAIEPLVRPLGWDWRIACAVIASFPAREVVIGTLGVIYAVGDDADETSVPLRQRLKTASWDDTGAEVYNIPVALSIMVFFALCAQCVSTLAIMYRETGSWRWPFLAFTYMTLLAYLGALLTYQIGSRLAG